MNPAGVVQEKGAGPVRRLTCSCCGEGTRGRQWWNRDTGYGLCVKCADWIKTRKEGKYYDADEFRRSYGEKGVHWGIE